MTAIQAVASLITALWPDPVPPRCGISVCGWTRLGYGGDWPTDPWTIPAYVNVARCGASFCGRIAPDRGIFAGLLPVMYSRHVTLGLTEQPGGQADRHQYYSEAYDNPALTLHIIGDRLEWLDRIADTIRAALDRTAHHVTPYGEINTLAIDPPARNVRGDRPRYDVTMTINAEFVRDSDQVEEQ